MATRTHRSQRRTQALSRERIVEAAVELLGAAGESGLTFRTLSEHLATGPGAIYWHVANKDELLGAATDAVVAAALAVEPALPADATPRDRIHAVALGLFDAIDRHPWIAGQLTATTFQSTTPRIFESIGRQIRDLGVPRSGWFTATSALVEYILGAAGQNAANGRVLGPGADRTAYLDSVSRAWEDLDPDDFPFTRAVADQLREHDDREQFLAGIDLLLAGVTARHLPGDPAATPPAP
ncbi:TetR family transcriptional regulator [Kitasatospora sp. NPDC094015]|uniref:TetR/AcrR family transcriptional regulator n=1 Tax=Kitasatospora sp. NPDC094015 TaxID=3155205 RepID=UPI0033278F92